MTASEPQAAPIKGTRRIKGEGGISEGTGRNLGRFRGYKSIGGTRRYTSWVDTRMLAIGLIANLRAPEPVVGTPHDGRTLGEALEGWIRLSGQAGTTLGNNLQKIRTMLKDWTPRPVASINRDQLSEFYMHTLPEAGYAPATIRLAASIIVGGMSYAHDRLWISSNPSLGIKKPKVAGEDTKGFSPKDRQKILDAMAGTRYEVRWRIGLLWYMRPAEVLGIRWSDLDQEEGTLVVRGQLQRLRLEVDGKPLGTVYREAAKSSAGNRTLWLDAETLELLKKWQVTQAEERKTHTDSDHQVARRVAQALRLKAAKSQRLLTEHRLYHAVPDDLVFTLASGDPILPRKDADEWRALLASVAIPHNRLYSMRHTGINHMLSDGASPAAVSVSAGHKTTAFTERVYGGDRSNLGRGLAGHV